MIRLRWFVATLPLALLALFAYAAFEWLFFVTKPSSVSVLPMGERLLVLIQAPVPFVPLLCLVQLAASALSLFAFPRLRALALVPAAAVLAALVLILTDNFLYAIFRISVASSESFARVAYVTIIVASFVLWLRKLDAELARVSRRAIVAMWCVAVAVTGFGGVVIALQQQPAAGVPAFTHDRPNILLLSIDGIDAERLSVYGYARPTSPFLASIRGESLVAENAFSNGSQTYTSLTSMLTGQLPFSSKVVVPPALLRGPGAFQHLPGIARRSGYRTLQLTMRHFADAEDAGLRNGFERGNYRWENRLSTPLTERVYDVARPFRLAAIDRLDARLGRILGIRGPAREYAHVIGEAEDPYWSDERRLRSLDAFLAGAQPWMAHVHLLDTHFGEYQKKGVEDYDAALREADERVRQIFGTLRRTAQLERTIVVITSDHGSNWLTTSRVPLLIRFPRGAHARSESRNVQLVDIVPTILAYAGVPRPAWLDGSSLLRPQDVPPDRMIAAVAASGPALQQEIFVIDVPRPPNHGARTVSAIIGSTWYVVDLANGAMTSGAVAGHTRPQPPLAREEAMRRIGAFLRAAGFRIG
ncbi:MAG TPA: sulfatase [Thermoanaerobaculia bacterium]|nr:sulfatase [Thermoanaerobaculia bacterium]